MFECEGKLDDIMGGKFEGSDFFFGFKCKFEVVLMFLSKKVKMESFDDNEEDEDDS